MDRLIDMLTQPSIQESDELTPSGHVKLWYQTAYLPVKDRIKLPSLWPPPDAVFFKIIALLEAVEGANLEWLKYTEPSIAADQLDILHAAAALKVTP